MVSYPYWTTDLNEVAYTMLECIIIEQMENDGYSIEDINIYISDLKNEKLGNLDYYLTSVELSKLISLQD